MIFKKNKAMFRKKIKMADTVDAISENEQPLLNTDPSTSTLNNNSSSNLANNEASTSASKTGNINIGKFNWKKAKESVSCLI